MSENNTRRKTPKEFFASFSEESENALYFVDYTTKFKKNISLCYWLLVWLQNNNELTLLLTDTGTHSDLF